MIPGSGRSSAEGNGNSLQCSCLENPIDRGTWQATVYGIVKSRRRLHFHTFKSRACHPSLCFPGPGQRWQGETGFLPAPAASFSPSCLPFQPSYLYEILSTLQNKPCHSLSLPSVSASLMKPPPITPDDILTIDCPSVFHFDTIFFTFFLILLGFMHKMKLLSQPDCKLLGVHCDLYFFVFFMLRI